MEKSEFREISLSLITPSPHNPRKSFDPKGMDELVESIRAIGILEPIVVRPVDPLAQEKPKGKKALTAKSEAASFEIVAGERRYRALSSIAKKNGGLVKTTIPCMVRVMSDDQAFDAMVIENLARQDLDELEEARGFKAYLDRKGPEALEDLSGRTGISPGYIRRRVRVLDLPDEVLDAWDGDSVRFGHLEQLLRIPDKDDLLEQLEVLVDERMSVKELKSAIDDQAIPLKSALFSAKDAGCNTCAFNSSTQMSLFDVESKKALCMKTACFKEHQRTWLTDNWPQFRKTMKLITNAFVFDDNVSWQDYERFWGDAVPDDCMRCESFGTILRTRGEIYEGRVCLGDKGCFRKLTAPSSTSSGPAPRDRNHGPEFREKFFQQQIPLRLKDVDPSADKSFHLALFALLSSNKDAKTWYGETYKVGKVKHPGESWAYLEIDDRVLFRTITDISLDETMLRIKEVSAQIALQERTYGVRPHVAAYLGVDIGTEWEITEEYLKRKTKAEIIELGNLFEIFSSGEAKAFLFETLGKKRGKFETCKKSELVQVFLESGIDLAGKIPSEILQREDVPEGM
ncbi:ParB/RepB/Spo0J family partition protein [Desulfatibacillum aliphaticivorans]|uniref:ParB/RepB/Spo0J family partition protein n=1 Tax=Desulfatibacillum aliphaticivorans TaxID=218208 RepID=UPI0003F63098|nr:ParB/RepB/Spo0J family partition protein [Desulfatibacillum aliphaticivorans]